MGGTSKFKFPMPHRRSKQPTLEVQTISAPMTNKAQKFLGQAEINVDSASPTSSNTDSARFWETRSAVSGVSGISVTISESTATGTVTKSRSPLGTLQESTVATSSMGNNRAAWEQESEIIPKGLGRTHNVDTITDASSVRRRGSSSTIASYYDKTKLPLSISQQTSNSAMAKGLPNKAHELLDMDSPRPAPSPPKPDRKRSTRLDLSHLLPTSGTSSRNALSRLAHKGSMVLGPDLMTRSPSVVSLSSAVSPSDTEPKPEKKPRRRLTRESLRGLRGPRTDRQSTLSMEEAESASLHMRAMDAGTLHHLYEHYEHTSFRDTMNADALECRPESQQGGLVTEAEPWAATRRDSRHSASIASTTSNKLRRPSSAAASRQPYTTFAPDSTYDPTSEMSLSATNADLVSPPTDYAASVSSRHTRTSRASKWTDHSFTDFDPNANSVLSLSSDSEDESSEPSRTAMSVLSVASVDSMSSPPESRRPSNTSLSQESIRKQLKSKFRSSVNSQAPFLAIPEDIPSTTGTSQPAVNPRTTSSASALASTSATHSLQSNATPSITSSVRSPSRLSQVSTSTCESIASQVSRPHPSVTGRQAPDTRHVAMLQSRTASTGHRHHEHASVAEKPRRRSRKHSEPRISEPTPPISPSGMEVVTSGQKKSTTGQDSPALTLNGTGGAEDERFIAVTRQEELLLAAMRAKRALMRESHQAIGVGCLDRGQAKDERSASKKESLSSIKTVKANTLLPLPLNLRPSGASNSSSSSSNNDNNNEMTMLFPKPPTAKPGATIRVDGTSEVESGSEEVMLCLNRTISEMQPLDMADMSPDLRDLMHYKSKQLPAPPSSSTHSATRSSRSRTSSAAPATGLDTHPKTAQHETNPRPDSDLMLSARPSSVQTHRMPDVALISEWHPTDIEPVMERPGSSSSYYEEEPEVEKQPPSRMRQVRISAVGMQLPEIGQWGDDG